FSESWARRLPVRAFECRRFGFGMLKFLLFSYSICCEYTSERSSDHLPPPASTRTSQGSDFFRTSDTNPCNPRGKWHAKEHPIKSVREERPRAANLLPDNN